MNQGPALRSPRRLASLPSSNNRAQDLRMLRPAFPMHPVFFDPQIAADTPTHRRSHVYSECVDAFWFDRFQEEGLRLVLPPAVS